MEKLTLGLEIKFQANVAMWLLFYKNAKENVSEAARPGSSVSCPGSAEVHRQESAGLLTPKCLVCSTDSILPPWFLAQAVGRSFGESQPFDLAGSQGPLLLQLFQQEHQPLSHFPLSPSP